MSFIEKLEPKRVFDLRQEVPIGEDQISSQTLVQRDDLGITLFALDKDEEIQAHSSTGDALVQILTGTAEITIDNEKYTVQAGQSIVMPANVQHALYAVDAFQMLLTVVKPEKA